MYGIVLFDQCHDWYTIALEIRLKKVDSALALVSGDYKSVLAS